MSAVILRRRKLGRGSTNGIANVSTTGISVVRNWVSNDWMGREGPPYLFRWGCTSSIPQLETEPVIVNTAKAIHWCSDKRQGRLDMQAANVPVPETVSIGTGNVAIPYPLQPEIKWVGRPTRHAQGRNIVTGTSEECVRQVSQWGGGYISRLINKVAEYRVMVVCNRVVWVAQKTPGNPEDVAWNVARGGRFDNVRWGNWKLPVIKAALAAAKVSGCDFCGVDVMEDSEGKPYVLEVNSAPSQTSPYRQQCVAKAFDYIVENGKKHFDDVSDSPRRTWKSFIHPAVRGEE